MNSENQASATCRKCGGSFTYEPIFVGVHDLARPLNTHCAVCQEEEATEQRRVDAEKRQDIQRQTVRQTIPPDLLPAHLDPLGTDIGRPDFNLPMWKLIRQWRPGKSVNWLALIGPPGVCKTRCLGLLAEKIIMSGHRVVWTSAMRLHTEATLNLRSRERELHIGAREHLVDCMNAPWLVVDDLGNNEWSPAFESQLFSILDHRKNHRLPVAYSSNAHPEEFQQCITSVNPAALIGRLLDRVDVFDFSGEFQHEMP